jgi:glycosyltransferase involved in cell wall biosynthesis
MIRPAMAFLHSAYVGAGGLGMCAATSLDDLARQPFAIHAYGPGFADWPLRSPVPAVTRHRVDAEVPAWVGRYTHRRWMAGRHLHLVSRAVGRKAARAIAADGADACYAFSGIALESLEWCVRNDVPSMLECATGHIRQFYDVSLREHRAWSGGLYLAHPSRAMVDREEEEYALSPRIRVSSAWAAGSFARYGVPRDKVRVVPQFLETERFVPPPAPRRHEGPLRLCFVGTITFAKGFPYLLEAMKRLGPGAADLEIAGSTGMRSARQVFDRLRTGLNVTVRPQDPVPVYHRSELLVFPSLSDGFAFAVAEAMACGLPVIVTDATGAAEWVTPESGWIVPAGDTDALTTAIAAARERRHELDDMGRAARSAVLRQIAGRAAALPLFDTAL